MDKVEWLVIGAGCAGIAAVGKLIDNKVSPQQIGWLDPAFQVGDLGAKWFNVSSNTKVALFLKFLHACKSFKYEECEKPFPIDFFNPRDTCYLKEIVAPLQWITDHLVKKVHAFQDKAIAMNFHDGYWEITLQASSITAKNVILAIGAEPKVLPLPHTHAIPLEIALNPEKLAKNIQPDETIGVFGSSHSAVLILANLLQLNPQTVYNFYISPHLYAMELDDWILFDDSGLKGFAAKWARENLDGILPQKLKRVLISDSSFNEALNLCDKLVYAVGFERRKIPVLEQFKDLKYQETTGIIAPQLFGVGIAFPQAKFDKFGNLEHRVGLWKFIDYLNTMVPLWLRYASGT